MNKVTLLPKWTLTSKFPSVYDTESGTCIEMTAKVYAAMRDLQTNYNEFVSEINTCITDFQNGVIDSQKEFEEKITKIIHDYIVTLDAKVDHQDRVIEENITYIKNNIGSEVTRIINEMKESGEIDAIIADSLDSINTRLTGVESNITSLQENVNNVTSKANTNETNIKSLQTNTTNLDERLDAIENSEVIDIYSRSKIDEINEEIDNLNNKGITVMIGDSYGVGQNPDGDVTGWCDHLKDLLQISDSNYFKFVKGGSGFIGYDNNGNTFLSLLSSNINSIADKTKVNRVIIGLAGNDSYNIDDDITTAMNEFFEYLYTQFPNAKVYIFPMGYNSGLTTEGKNLRLELTRLAKIYCRVGIENKCVVFKGAGNCLRLDSNMSSDHVHPTAEGYKEIALNMYSLLTTGKTIFNTIDLLYNSDYDTILNVTGGSSSTNRRLALRAIYHDDVVKIISINEDTLINFTSPVSTEGNTLIIGSINPINFKPTNIGLSCDTTGVINTNGTITNITYKLQISNMGVVSLLFPQAYQNINALTFNYIKIVESIENV